MISYAQNFEDVMLWRALKHIQNGFYVDIGAAWPDEHSVTKWFYDCNWCGINVEPHYKHFQRYVNERSRDINLNVAVDRSLGTKRMYFIEDTGLSSFDKKIVEQHQSHSGFIATPSNVEVRTLLDIFETYVQQKQIHFLKIDVEGFEKNVILGNDWHKYRPWIVVVEATLPMSQTESHKEWESLLFDADYIFTYADGLNRYYLAKEHSQLKEKFNYPPNVFDEFKLHHELLLENNVQQLQAEISSLQDKLTLSHEYQILAEEKQQLSESKLDLANNTIALLQEKLKHQTEQYEALSKNNQNKQKHIEQLAQQNAQLTQDIQARQTQIEQLEQQVVRFVQENQDKQNHVVQLLLAQQANETQLQLVYASTSWKVTKPLRIVSKCNKWFFSRVIAWILFKPKSRPRRYAKVFLLKQKFFILRHPRLKSYVLKVLNRFPRIKNKIKTLSGTIHHQKISAVEVTPQQQISENLSPREKILLQQLFAIKRKEKEL